LATNGNLVVAQGGGPTAVINSSLRGVAEQALKDGRVGTVYGAGYGLEGVLGENFLDLGAERAETLQALHTAPGAALGSSRKRLSEAEYHRVLEAFRDHDVRYFLYIGGNGSMAACHRLHALAEKEGADVHIVGVPKTVDNDIAGTDHCPGYGSACRYYAVSVSELGMDVESLPTPVSIFETMGRNAGWLAAATGLARRSEADAPHLVYVPEHSLSLDRFLDDVQRIYDEHGWVVAAVGEGVTGEKGEALSATPTAVPTDDFDRALPGGAAAALARRVGRELGLRARSEKPGLCGRASVAHVSEVDRREAYELGRAGVQRAVQGARGVMVALRREEDGSAYSCTLTDVPLGEVAGRERLLPARFMNEPGNMVSKAFCDYAAPLLGGMLPQHARLEGFAGEGRSKRA
jgi:6-phosphofructokinase 1